MVYPRFSVELCVSWVLFDLWKWWKLLAFAIFSFEHCQLNLKTIKRVKEYLLLRRKNTGEQNTITQHWVNDTCLSSFWAVPVWRTDLLLLLKRFFITWHRRSKRREIYEGGKKLHFIFTRGNSVAKIIFYYKIKLNFRPSQKDRKNVNYGLKTSLSSLKVKKSDTQMKTVIQVSW